LSGLLRPYGLAVRTPPFHGGSPGSIPGRVANTILVQFNQCFCEFFKFQKLAGAKSQR
jgi:hypothetical protein